MLTPVYTYISFHKWHNCVPHLKTKTSSVEHIPGDVLRTDNLPQRFCHLPIIKKLIGGARLQQLYCMKQYPLHPLSSYMYVQVKSQHLFQYS